MAERLIQTQLAAGEVQLTPPVPADHYEGLAPNLRFVTGTPMEAPEDMPHVEVTAGYELMARVNIPVQDGVRVPPGRGLPAPGTAVYQEEPFYVFRATQPGTVMARAGGDGHPTDVNPGDGLVFAGKDLASLEYSNHIDPANQGSMADLRPAVVPASATATIGRDWEFGDVLSRPVNPLASRGHALVSNLPDGQIAITTLGGQGTGLDIAVGAQWSQLAVAEQAPQAVQ